MRHHLCHQAAAFALLAACSTVPIAPPAPPPSVPATATVPSAVAAPSGAEEAVVAGPSGVFYAWAPDDDAGPTAALPDGGPVFVVTHPPATGTLPAGAVRRAISPHMDQVRACYQKGLGRNASLAGRVTFVLFVFTTGHADAAVEDGSELDDAPVLRCIVDVLESIIYPVPAGGMARVRYPMSFAAD